MPSDEEAEISRQEAATKYTRGIESLEPQEAEQERHEGGEVVHPVVFLVCDSVKVPVGFKNDPLWQNSR